MRKLWSIFIMMITPAQVRMARAALQWGTTDLAEKASVSPTSVNRYENGGGMQTRTIEAIEKAIIDAGVELIGTDGVRLAATVEA